MLETIASILEVMKISGVNGFSRLRAHSRRLAEHGRQFAVMHSLIALEKCHLNAALQSDGGLDVSAQDGIDASVLSTVCEYLYENDILTRVSPTVYKARNRRTFDSLLQSMYACRAYLDPVYALDKLLTGEYQYGRDVTRNDQYDAIASASLTSIFSYGFSWNLLRHAGCQSLLDVGCGTGEYLEFLERNSAMDELCGMDISEDAINQGKEMGFESRRVRLMVGDIFDLKKSDSLIRQRPVDVVSIMFVLHEFQKEQVESILKSVRDAYPQSRILLTELIRRSSDETRKAKRTVLPELKFVHELSRQVLRAPSEWKELFSVAGYGVVMERINRVTNQVCLLFAPARS